MPPKHIAIVTCSTRSPRLNPTITHYVHDVLVNDPALPTQHVKASSPTNPPSTDTDPRHITFSILDLAKQSLPLYDESVIPARLPAHDPTPHYTRPHTRAWSATVQSYDAFIFVTPQYNWSVPASLKNALDYLFHEWTGKPAGMVSYGSRGGSKATDHLRGILTGLKMRVVNTAPALAIKYTGLPIGTASEEEVRVDLDERDVEGWKQAGVEGMMRNLGMELVCELDRE
ncbi:NAD(P)H-dependent FMN reductase LOT6 [Penicillium oxalicum]|uniref:NAD(P)H-dependent FMN reductase LOT6 n=1 Tax=Penicillium oxalicum TaxID=69781 RepID=UPI0020B70F4B|nr:NAD(P)H-dependent FMN reductase LOT6 [Penicillium oxalicum]KAI2792406.1 NAD(P)H-dependent FMN reductase LOT6 [Penicillium oxalicum]